MKTTLFICVRYDHLDWGPLELSYGGIEVPTPALLQVDVVNTKGAKP